MAGIATMLAIIAGIIVSLGILWKALVAAYTFIDSIVEGMATIKDLPPWIEKVNTAIKELHPNHGTSMKDKLEQACDDIAEIKESVATQVHNMENENR